MGKGWLPTGLNGSGWLPRNRSETEKLAVLRMKAQGRGLAARPLRCETPAGMRMRCCCSIAQVVYPSMSPENRRGAW